MGATTVMATAGAMAVLAWVVSWLITRVEVVGGSMAPALEPGDRLLVVRWPDLVAPWPVPGEVVAVRDPRDRARVLVKRVAAVDRDGGTVEVRGDNESVSTDSRTFGPVHRSLVMGKAVYRYAPAGRVGGGPWHPGYDRSEAEPAGRIGSDPAGRLSATKGMA